MGRVWFQKRSLATRAIEWERDGWNLEVYGGATAKAHCLGGDATSYVVAAVGFGVGVGPAALTDVALTDPVYVKPISGTAFNIGGDGVSYVDASGGPAQVKWTYGVNAGSFKDYGLLNMTVTEVGLFANPAGLELPARTSPDYPTWEDAHSYALEDTITDSNGNVQVVTVAGMSDTPDPPSWPSTIGATTADGGVTWTCMALSDVSSLVLVARKVFEIGFISGEVGFSSSWTIIIPPGVVT